MRKLVIILLTCVLSACAARNRNCDHFYVILPGNYIVDLAAGAKVILDPASEEFALFCTAAQAQKALTTVNPNGDWRIYKMNGSFGEIARETPDGAYVLSAPAEVNDWVQ